MRWLIKIRKILPNEILNYVWFLFKFGDLRHFIDKKSFKSEQMSTNDYRNDNLCKLEWSIDLFEGLSHMHSKNVMHRDINPK